MHHAKGDRGERSVRSSTSVSLSPYLLEDIGLTASELWDVRRTMVMIVTPR